jgi:hypothetical protein
VTHAWAHPYKKAAAGMICVVGDLLNDIDISKPEEKIVASREVKAFSLLSIGAEH